MQCKTRCAQSAEVERAVRKVREATQEIEMKRYISSGAEGMRGCGSCLGWQLAALNRTLEMQNQLLQQILQKLDR